MTEQSVFQKELAGRRRRVLRSVGSDSIVCLFSAAQRNYSNDVCYPYRQDSNFYYLSGSSEDQMILVLAPGHSAGDYILFCEPNDESTTLWEGARMDLGRAKRELGADKVFPGDTFPEVFATLLAGRRNLYCDTLNAASFSQITVLCRQVHLTLWLFGAFRLSITMCIPTA